MRLLRLLQVIATVLVVARVVSEGGVRPDVRVGLTMSFTKSGGDYGDVCLPYNLRDIVAGA